IRCSLRAQSTLAILDHADEARSCIQANEVRRFVGEASMQGAVFRGVFAVSWIAPLVLTWVFTAANANWVYGFADCRRVVITPALKWVSFGRLPDLCRFRRLDCLAICRPDGIHLR